MKPETIYSILKKHFKSHSAVARELGYSVHHYADIRAGRKNLTARTLKMLEMLVERIHNDAA